MKIAVITPYYKESTDVLAKCHESVMAQGVDVDHFMIADGFPNPAVDGWRAKHIKLPRAHGDNGNTPRGIGAMLAQAEDYEFISFLDADNWFHLNHLASLLELYQKSRCEIVTSFRTFHTLEGTLMDVTESQEDRLEHIDTSCFMLHRQAFELLPIWLQMEKVLGPICDRVFLAAVRHKRFTINSTRLRTVAFRTQYESHYRSAGLSVPEGAKGAAEFKPAFSYLLTKDGVSNSLSRMGFWPGTYL
jgi:glycosyltransferase involved in cell wall biosynthesis